jgi:hypothetical protein
MSGCLCRHRTLKSEICSYGCTLDKPDKRLYHTFWIKHSLQRVAGTFVAPTVERICLKCLMLVKGVFFKFGVEVGVGESIEIAPLV